MTTVRMPKSVYDAFQGDETDPLHPLLRYVGYMKELGVEIVGDEAVIKGVTDYGLFSPLAVAGIVQKGGEVDNYPCYIKIPEADYENEVPAHMPRSEVVDENGSGTGVQKKWSEYKDATHNHQLIDGYYYVENDGHGGFLVGSQIVALVTAGYTVLNQPDMLALISGDPE